MTCTTKSPGRTVTVTDDTYTADDEITVRVWFSSSVEVSGTPELAIDIGGVKRQATCNGDNGATGDQYMDCSYTVVSADSDTDGISIGANSVTKPSGTTIRLDGMDIPLEHDAVGADSGHKVNGGT